MDLLKDSNDPRRHQRTEGPGVMPLYERIRGMATDLGGAAEDLTHRRSQVEDSLRALKEAEERFDMLAQELSRLMREHSSNNLQATPKTPSAQLAGWP
jgi:hypothetical protein